MCFSPAASFTAAGVTATAGIFALRQCTSWREAPLAATPLLFAVQQAAEGMIWLQLVPRPGPSLHLFADIFTILALVAWPVLVPAAALLVEPLSRKRRVQGLLLAAGLAASAYSLWDILHHPYVPSIVGSSICYINNNAFSIPATAAYFLATPLPLLISSHNVVRLFGLVVLAGLAVSLAAFYFTFVSVWCFFAAAASLLLYAHFRRNPVSPLIRIKAA